MLPSGRASPDGKSISPRGEYVSEWERKRCPFPHLSVKNIGKA